TTADRYDSTVGIDLLIHDSAKAGHPPDLLGRQLVPPVDRSGKFGAEKLTSVTLTYPLGPNLTLTRFDELIAVYKMASIRADQAPRIGIDRFVFVPR
ncbi:MAG: hypothetical protein H7039_18870, partial [Bryobacteraceae bacterium]|nr:hypothetical protein [Bryobacteraceae bacterium]